MGIQLPNFIQQYQQSLTAHYQESNRQLQKYQEIADQFYAGNIERLLSAHKQNTMAAIRAEADIISELIVRSNYLQQQLNALQQKPLLDSLIHLTQYIDPEITDEVLQNYTLSFPLNSQAILIGLTLALIGSFTIHILLALLGALFHQKPSNALFYRP